MNKFCLNSPKTLYFISEAMQLSSVALYSHYFMYEVVILLLFETLECVTPEIQLYTSVSTCSCKVSQASPSCVQEVQKVVPDSLTGYAELPLQVPKPCGSYWSKGKFHLRIKTKVSFCFFFLKRQKKQVSFNTVWSQEVRTADKKFWWGLPWQSWANAVN